jgi:hypothetical protein
MKLYKKIKTKMEQWGKYGLYTHSVRTENLVAKITAFFCGFVLCYLSLMLRSCFILKKKFLRLHFHFFDFRKILTFFFRNIFCLYTRIVCTIMGGVRTIRKNV